MVDEIKAFNLLSEMIIEIRELRNSVSRLTRDNMDLKLEIKELNKLLKKENDED